jgi:hypothetical protein
MAAPSAGRYHSSPCPPSPLGASGHLPSSLGAKGHPRKRLGRGHGRDTDDALVVMARFRGALA